MLDTPRSLPDYMIDLLSAGRAVFTRDEAASALGITTRGFLKAAERQQRRNALLNPRHGFYVVVPPQYLSWGAPPPSWYIDDLMRHEAHPYYVGLLKAAELHGATHQAVMLFQVITDKRIPKIHAGRSIISFVYRKDMDRIASAIVDHKTATGRMKISSPELTAVVSARREPDGVVSPPSSCECRHAATRFPHPFGVFHRQATPLGSQVALGGAT